MRILVYFREHRFGGVHTYLKHQISFLVHQGHDVWVSYADENTRALFAGIGARTFANKELVRSPFRIDKDLIALWRLYQICRQQRIDCIFSHTSKGGAIARVAGYLARTPKRIHVVHGFAFHEHSRLVVKMAGQWVERLLSVLTTHLISVNAADKEMAINDRICPPWKIKTIKNGVPFPNKSGRLSNQAKDRFLKTNGFSRDHHIVLFVGRLMKQKNPQYLLKALALIDNPKAHLVIIGEGPQKEDLKQAIKEMELNHRVHLLGFRKDVDRWYQACSVFVLPSLWEGLPMTLLEAMGAGACCVVTDIKGNRECIANGRDGILVPCNNTKILSNTIWALMEDHAFRTRLGAAASDKVISEFSVQRMCEETHQVLCSDETVHP